MSKNEVKVANDNEAMSDDEALTIANTEEPPKTAPSVQHQEAKESLQDIDEVLFGSYEDESDADYSIDTQEAILRFNKAFGDAYDHVVRENHNYPDFETFVGAALGQLRHSDDVRVLRDGSSHYRVQPPIYQRRENPMMFRSREGLIGPRVYAPEHPPTPVHNWEEEDLEDDGDIDIEPEGSSEYVDDETCEKLGIETLGMFLDKYQTNLDKESAPYEDLRHIPPFEREIILNDEVPRTEIPTRIRNVFSSDLTE